MKKIIVSLFIISLSLNVFSQQFNLQTNSLKVAVVAPLYINEAFNKGLIKDQLPSQMRAGLDFIHGVQIALDTIQTKGKKIEVMVVDTKDNYKDLNWAINQGNLDKANLIITSERQDEFSQLAAFANEKEIPLVSAVYPNDGGAKDNPYLIITNSTLSTNIQGVYNYIVLNQGTNPVFLIKSPQEDRVFNYFDEINKINQYNLANIKLIETDRPDSAFLSRYIDTNKHAIIIGGTLEKDMALKIADGVSGYKNVRLIGMPNWNSFKELFDRDRYPDFPILFPTPHFVSRDNKFYHYLANRYYTEYRLAPSDVAEKGFETTYKFVGTLINFPNSFMQHINDKTFNTLHNFNIRPQYVPGARTMSYYENKHISLVQILNGRISQAY